MFCIRDNACVNHVGLFSPKYDLKQMSNATFSLFLAKSWILLNFSCNRAYPEFITYSHFWDQLDQRFNL